MWNIAEVRHGRRQTTRRLPGWRLCACLCLCLYICWGLGAGQARSADAPTRKAFVALIGDAHPTVTVEPATSYPDKKQLPAFLFRYAVDRYHVKYANGYEFSALLIKNSGKNLLIYNHGHDPQTFTDAFSREFLERYLRSGGSLLLTWMPLLDPRFPPDAPLSVKLWNTDRRIDIRTVKHDVLTLFDSGDYHFFRYFLDPVLLPLERIAENYERISYVGLSGGGWMGLVLSALDTPIQRYVLVAGFLPEEAKVTRLDIGDVEQLTPDVYRRFSYSFFLDQLNTKDVWVVYNTEDDCCYGADEHRDLIRRMENTWTNIRFVIRPSKTHSYAPDMVLDIVAPGAPRYSWWERLFGGEK